jgi:Lipoprotein LpqB beta-propeller domain
MGGGAASRGQRGSGGARRCAAALGLLLVAALGGVPGTRAASLEVYGRLPRLENVALSPDGSRIAFVKTVENTRTVAVAALGAHQMLGGLRVGDQKLRQISWADNDHLLIVTSVTGRADSCSGTSANGSRCRCTTSGAARPSRFPAPIPSTRSM